MKPFRSSSMSIGLSVGSSNIGIATPTSSFSDPIADLPDAVAPMQQEFMTTGDFGHCPDDVHIKTTHAFLFSNLCFPSVHHHFRPCNTFFDTSCDLFEHMNDNRREYITSASGDGPRMSTLTKISDTSTGSSNELSLSGIQKVFHVKKGYAIITGKSVH